MEIILTQDVTGVGYKNDLLTVKNGFGRNYLIPKGLAVIATESRKKELEEVNKQQAFKLEKVKKEAEVIAEALEGAKFTIPVKASESGKIFGSVNNVMVANAIQEEKNLEIDRKNIKVVNEPIKEVGKHKAKVHLHKEIVVEIDLDVIAD